MNQSRNLSDAEYERVCIAARLLYGAHERVRMDTDEDRELQAKVLGEARSIWPPIVDGA